MKTYYNRFVRYVLIAYLVTRLVDYYNNDFKDISVFSIIILSSLLLYIIYWYYLDYKKDKLKNHDY